jgi:phage terminase small subunit
MYKIDLSAATVSMLFQHVLKADYVRTMQEMSELKSRTDLQPHEHEDLMDLEEYCNGFEILLNYYLPHYEASELIDSMNQKKDVVE